MIYIFKDKPKPAFQRNHMNPLRLMKTDSPNIR